MKSAIVIIITIVIVLLGVIVGVTFMFGRTKEGGTLATGASQGLFGLGARAAADGGMFYSKDGGVTWEQRVKFGNSTIGAIDIYDAMYIPSRAGDGKTLLGTAGNGLFISTTGGSDWIRVEDQNTVLQMDASVNQIAYDPHNSDYVYLAVLQGDTGKLLKSDNGGYAFKEVYRTPKAKSAVFSVTIDPSKSERIFMGTAEGGLLVSENRGESWSVNKWFKSPVRRIHFHPTDADFIYLTFLGTDSAKVMRSHDHAANWEELKITPPKGQRISAVYALTFHPTDKNVLFLGTSSVALKTKDAGATWEELPLIIPPSLLPVFTVVVDPKHPDIMYVSAAAQIYKSKDAGVSWQVYQLPTSKFVRALFFDPQSSDNLWAVVRK